MPATYPRLCLATSYTTNFTPMGDCCAASLRRYSEQWGCGVHVEIDPVFGRPPAWHRVKLIPELFDLGYEFVLWLDADAMFVRFDRDVLDEIRPGKEIYLVQHQVPWHPSSPVPNTGVMLLRNTNWSRGLLDRLWSMDQYLHHVWWENAAMIDLLGYRDHLGGTHEPEDEILTRIRFLDETWNNSPLLPAAADDCIVRHWGGMPHDRRTVGMRRDAIRLGLVQP